MKKLMNLLVGILALLMVSACADLKAIAQGSIDQFAARDAGSSRNGVSAGRFQIPEDALRLRDKQLAEAMLQLGRKVARGYAPKAQLVIAVATQEDADWLIASIDRGITQTGWPREAVMLPPYVHLTHSYPSIHVYEGIKG